MSLVLDSQSSPGAGGTDSLLVLSQSSVNDTHVEEDLGRVRDLLELLQRLVELIVVVTAKGRYPRFYFLYRGMSATEQKFPVNSRVEETHLFQRHVAVTDSERTQNLQRNCGRDGGLIQYRQPQPRTVCRLLREGFCWCGERESTRIGRAVRRAAGAFLDGVERRLARTVGLSSPAFEREWLLFRAGSRTLLGGWRRTSDPENGLG
jgi:hypothetical protein